MAGLIKAKQYDWKDSNLALFGSSTEREVKQESAKHEPAWKKAGQDVGLQIWRIVNFKVTAWPKEDYGKFYDGDSYIILNTYKVPNRDVLFYDVHFWIGKYSTQDEYCTAAYKTVELDTFLDDIPIQHREVQGHESDLFRSYFNTIEILKGGAESGFKHVQPEEYTPRLLHLHGDRFGVSVKEVPRLPNSLDSTDVYVLDLGLKIIQWNGSGSNKDERFKGAQYTREMMSGRSGKAKIEVVEEGQDTREFMRNLDGQEETVVNYDAQDKTKELYRLSDASGKMNFSLEKKGKLDRSDLDSGDVFILDAKSELYVWVGENTTQDEKKNAMIYAHNYLKDTDHPLIQVTCLHEKTSINHSGFDTALVA